MTLTSAERARRKPGHPKASKSGRRFRPDTGYFRPLALMGISVFRPSGRRQPLDFCAARAAIRTGFQALADRLKVGAPRPLGGFEDFVATNVEAGANDRAFVAAL